MQAKHPSYNKAQLVVMFAFRLELVVVGDAKVENVLGATGKESLI